MPDQHVMMGLELRLDKIAHINIWLGAGLRGRVAPSVAHASLLLSFEARLFSPTITGTGLNKTGGLIDSDERNWKAPYLAPPGAAYIVLKVESEGKLRAGRPCRTTYA